jgi:hypothetical protein
MKNIKINITIVFVIRIFIKIGIIIQFLSSSEGYGSNCLNESIYDFIDENLNLISKLDDEQSEKLEETIDAFNSSLMKICPKILDENKTYFDQTELMLIAQNCALFQSFATRYFRKNNQNKTLKERLKFLKDQLVIKFPKENDNEDSLKSDEGIKKKPQLTFQFLKEKAIEFEKLKNLGFIQNHCQESWDLFDDKNIVSQSDFEKLKLLPPPTFESMEIISGDKAGINPTYKVSFDGKIQGIFKPDNAKSLGSGKIEAFAYDLDQMLGFNLIPPTVFRKDMNGGILKAGSIECQVKLSGSVQKFMEGAKHYESSKSQSDKMRLLDYLINNCDRHKNNVMKMVDESGNITGQVAIDNGLAFNYKYCEIKRKEPGGQDLIPSKVLVNDKVVLEKLKNFNFNDFLNTCLKHELSNDFCNAESEKFKSRVEAILKLEEDANKEK